MLFVFNPSRFPPLDRFGFESVIQHPSDRCVNSGPARTRRMLGMVLALKLQVPAVSVPGFFSGKKDLGTFLSTQKELEAHIWTAWWIYIILLIFEKISTPLTFFHLPERGRGSKKIKNLKYPQIKQKSRKIPPKYISLRSQSVSGTHTGGPNSSYCSKTSFRNHVRDQNPFWVSPLLWKTADTAGTRYFKLCVVPKFGIEVKNHDSPNFSTPPWEVAESEKNKLFFFGKLWVSAFQRT